MHTQGNGRKLDARFARYLGRLIAFATHAFARVVWFSCQGILFAANFPWSPSPWCGGLRLWQEVRRVTNEQRANTLHLRLVFPRRFESRLLCNFR